MPTPVAAKPIEPEKIPFTPTVVEPKTHINQAHINHLEAELKIALYRKNSTNDEAKLQLIDRQVDSLFAAIKQAGYDVVFTDNQETQFILQKQ